MVNGNHPIARGVGPFFEIERSEMYGEPFTIPEPLETVFISWYQGGEVFRSGVTFRRGGGRIFYFGAGHEVYPIYHDTSVQQVLRNAAKWAADPAGGWTEVGVAKHTPAAEAPEPLSERGDRLHGGTEKASG